MREVLERRFRFEICEVSCGEEAVDYVQECQIDIVLLDMHMHHMTGLDTIRVLKDMNALRPCILITSDDSDELRRDASEVNAHTVLQKPVRRQELVKTVSRALHDAYDAPLTDDFLA
ncbi:MAG: response regulator [Fuerstiella sp.]|nr:response regulator [Fuerstiella sp.]